MGTEGFFHVLVELLKGQLAQAQEDAVDAQLKANIAAKGRVYQKYLAGNIKKTVVEHHLEYMQ